MQPPANAFDPASSGDYHLGTDDVEVRRLGLQHALWRGEMHEGWRSAGLTEGMSAVDVGAGPGHATIELADVVGRTGSVLALERSPRFTNVLRDELQRRDLRNVELRQVDLLSSEAADADWGNGYDIAWARWIACFLTDLDAYVRLLARLVRPGGRLVTHEYAHYRTWSSLPPWPQHASFIREVLSNWQADGGEPDVAAPLSRLLVDAGFEIKAVRPMVFVASPDDPLWQWPATFIRSHCQRLVELGRVSEEWATDIVTSFDTFETTPGARMITPMVLEIVAERQAR